MISLDSIKNEFSSLASVPDDEINAVLSEAKRKTILLRSVLKLSIIFISGCLYLLAKAYLMDKGYSRFTSMLGSIFIIKYNDFLYIISVDINLPNVKT